MIEGLANTLEGFDGWDEGIELFGEPVVEEPLTQKKETETITEDAPEETTTEEEEEVLLFSDDTDEPEDSTSEETLPVTDPTSKASSLLKGLKEAGLVQLEDFDEDLDDDAAQDLLEDTFESSLNTRLVSMINDLPDKAQQLVKFAVNGGDVDKLLETMMEQRTKSVDLGQVDLTNESDQARTMRALLIREGYDAETADIQVEALKESRRLETTVNKRYDVWKAGQDKLSASEVQAQETRNAELKRRQRDYRRSLEKTVGNRELKGVRLSPQDRQELPDYVSKPTVLLENGRKVTQMQADIYAAMGDPEKTALLAKVLRDDFDFSSYRRDAETKVTKKELKSIRRESSKTNTAKPQSLAELLNL